MPKTKTVLIVEDDETYRGLLADILNSEGIKTQTASNGKEALDKLSRGKKFDLIILDLLMPEMSGWEFMYKIPKTQSKNVPIMVLTNLTETSYPSDVPVQIDLMIKANVSVDEITKKVKKHLSLE